MINKKSNLFLCSLCFFASSLTHAADDRIKHHLYVGALGGFGSTTWYGLIANKQHQNGAMMLSTPIKAEEGGGSWGVLAGYEFTPSFALETNYMHFPSALVMFDSTSLFTFLHQGKSTLTTRTEAISVLGKIMLTIPNTALRFYSSAGVANIHREDFIIDDWRVSPTFGLGLNFSFTNHFMAELAGNYTAGFGESQINPVDTYFPFLYSVTLHLSYCF